MRRRPYLPDIPSMTGRTSAREEGKEPLESHGHIAKQKHIKKKRKENVAELELAESRRVQARLSAIYAQ